MRPFSKIRNVQGSLQFNSAVDPLTAAAINDFADTGNLSSDAVALYNLPSFSSGRCGWKVKGGRLVFEGESPDNIVAWLMYVQMVFIDPRNYDLVGTVSWSCANPRDDGRLEVRRNGYISLVWRTDP